MNGQIETETVDGLGGLGCPSERDAMPSMKRRVRPLFRAHWDRVVFMHFEANPEALQRRVPFPLDLFEGKRAFVSLVAFAMRDMRFYSGGKWTKWLTRRIGTHAFLNLRAYVRGGRGGEPGIFFLREWLDSRPAVKLGPVTFGLPYRFGEIDYEYPQAPAAMSGIVDAAEGRLAFRATIGPGKFHVARRGSFEEFLLERYTAYTRFRWGLKAFFRVWHEPWSHVQVRNLEIGDGSLLESCTDPACGLRFAAAHFSAGSGEVWMGFPRLIGANGKARRAGRTQGCGVMLR